MGLGGWGEEEGGVGWIEIPKNLILRRDRERERKRKRSMEV